MAGERSGLSLFLRPQMALIFALGFSSGLPLALTGGTLQAWMTDEKVDLKAIGAYALVGIPYTWKFVWAPLLDRFVPPLGRRRGWMIVWQAALVLALVALSFLKPAQQPVYVAMAATLVAFASASQDIAIDAYRTEILEPTDFSAGASVNVFGYRMAMLASGSLALILADHFAWSFVYRVMAASMFVGMIAALVGPEPRIELARPRSLGEAVLVPLRDYFGRKGALEMLAFIVLYKFGDNLASSMTMPFYMKMGFTKTEIGVIGKTVGMVATIVGGFVGAGLLVRLGLKRALWFFGFLQAFSTAGFWLLARVEPTRALLSGVIGFENLTGGMGASAYAALLMTLCNKRFTATQYALLTSLMAVMVKGAGAASGFLAARFGWEIYFLICVFSAAPGMLLLLRYDAWTTETNEKDAIVAANEVAAEA